MVRLFLLFPRSENQPKGNLLTEIHNLTELQSLLVYSDRPAEIPRELGHLSKLRHLEMYGDSIQGQIPSELGELSSLVKCI